MTSARTILLVDDDEDSVHALSKVLQNEGFKVVAATDGRQALDHLSTSAPPDAMLVDLMMPGMDGWELVHEVRQRPRLATLPMVVISGGGERALARSPLADGHFGKPVDLDRLLALLRRLIAERSPAEAEGSEPPSSPGGRRSSLSQRLVVPVVLAIDCADSFSLTKQPVIARCNAILKTADFESASQQVAALRPIALIAPASLFDKDGRFLEVLARSVGAQLIAAEDCEDPVGLETRLRSNRPPAK